MIDTVLLLSAPSGAGKTVMARRILADRVPPLAGHLGIRSFGGWKWEDRQTATDLEALAGERVLFEYNSAARYCAGLPYAEDEAFAIARWAHRVFIVTLWTQPEQLKYQRLAKEALHKPFVRKGPDTNGDRTGQKTGNKQKPRRNAAPSNALRIIARGASELLVRSVIGSRPGRKWLDAQRDKHSERIPSIYFEPDGVIGLYREWVRFCDVNFASAAGHLIVEHRSRAIFHSRAEWEQALDIGSSRAA